ncbi:MULTISPECIES: hypothetical protein [unclassified Bacillus cereus group]|uniref:hypothetical protein n=1 Tax=unclassified Bacillus cereus group TaxID=2750818 RepID=UPI0015D41038|nr:MULTISPECIES: hypothetical protein [unclassified Bacillus cereus group]
MKKLNSLELINKINALNNLGNKEPLVEFLKNLKENGGGHITVNQLLDFLKEIGYIK